MWKNSAVPMLLERINQLEKRIEILEWLQHPTYTNITNTAVTGTWSDLWPRPTITTWATPTVYYRNAHEDRLADIERQLDQIQNIHYEVRDGNLYINYWNNDWDQDWN